MKEVVRQEILDVFSEAIKILQVKETKDFEELKELSEQAIEDVAAHKDVDLIAVTVLIYSIYKVVSTLSGKDYQSLLAGLEEAKESLGQNNFGRYNHSIRSLYEHVRGCNAKVKVHLQDVMHAARIKKGTSLLARGLSIGQAAGLMGLSNWDLQQYAARTTVLDPFGKIRSAKKRLQEALTIFGVR